MTYTRSLSTVFAALALAFAGCAEAQTGGEPTTISGQDEVEVYEIMRRVADWQLAQYRPEDNAFYDIENADAHPQGWVYAALYVGMSAWAEMSGTPRYWDELRRLAKRNKYLFAPRIYNADDYAIGQLYIDLYEMDGDLKYLAPLKTVFETILASPSTVSLEFAKADGFYEYYRGLRYSIVPCKNRWCWADALFMGPPVWIHLAEITGDQRYIDFADGEFWATTDLLFDKDEHLFFRDTRYFDQREENGAKVFWGRGNGWVIAGIVRILQHLPSHHPNRGRYEQLLRKMAGALRRSQTADGYWRPSILAPDAFANPESSGTGFIVYGLAWGVNNGILDEGEYAETIARGWRSLVNSVHPDGKLGWVQQVASKPGSATYDDTQLYGVGAFLLAGSEIHKLVAVEKQK